LRLAVFPEERKPFTQEKGNEPGKKRKSIPIFKVDEKRKNLNYLLILISYKNFMAGYRNCSNIQ
jgi:hypothetical protein